MAHLNKATREFWKCLSEMHPDHQRLAKDRFRTYCLGNPRHPALNGHRVPLKDKSVGQAWAVEAGCHNRALAQVEVVGGVEVFKWFWIGSHEAYNNKTR